MQQIKQWIFYVGLIASFSSFAKNPPPLLDKKLKSTIANLQKLYNGTKDFSADFVQSFQHAILKKTETLSGRVIFLKPGFMRWDYHHPEPKSFIVDGSSLWIYKPTDKQALVNRCFKQDALTASIAFLWGGGQLEKEFVITHYREKPKESTDIWLELIPKKKDAAFEKLILAIDPQTKHVKQSTVMDIAGNLNQFTFSHIHLNSGLKKESFAFNPPTQTHVSEIPGCSEPRLSHRKSPF